LVGVMVSPYFLSKPLSAAITTGAQSVSGMKPILRSGFSGASEPAAQAALRIGAGTRFSSAAAPVVASAPRSRLRRAGLTGASAVAGLRFLSTSSMRALRECPSQKKAHRHGV
jgi:hypothetical protein